MQRPVNIDFAPVTWDADLVDDCRQLVRLAVREDLGRGQDWTTVALVPRDAQARAAVVAREAGVVAGLPSGPLILAELNCRATFAPLVADGAAVQAGTRLAELQGSARDLLTCERLLLNILGRLAGIATLTSRYVQAVAGTRARVYDTRKTTPGWRRLEKYAVRCGGGFNHRTGLFDAVLIKDNHLAQVARGGPPLGPAEAVAAARRFLKETSRAGGPSVDLPVEVEVDNLEQLRAALAAGPDIVLVDNFSLARLREAVALRDSIAPGCPLEASGGVNLETVRSIAETGVERISVGALTHSARSLDVALDWNDPEA
jgi:nicotinate-nucleotide pyrophosphorylase (carboxylating)